jgi:hypothetical protein
MDIKFLPVWIRRRWEIQGSTLIGSKSYGCDMRAEVEQKRVQTSTKTNRTEDTKPQPVETP